MDGFDVAFLSHYLLMGYCYVHTCVVHVLWGLYIQDVNMLVVCVWISSPIKALHYLSIKDSKAIYSVHVYPLEYHPRFTYVYSDILLNYSFDTQFNTATVYYLCYLCVGGSDGEDDLMEIAELDPPVEDQRSVTGHLKWCRELFVIHV